MLYAQRIGYSGATSGICVYGNEFLVTSKLWEKIWDDPEEPWLPLANRKQKKIRDILPGKVEL